jgi:hypothetical protein
LFDSKWAFFFCSRYCVDLTYQIIFKTKKNVRFEFLERPMQG